MILNNRTGNFIFNNPSTAVYYGKSAVQRVTTFIDHSWLKDLLFSHNDTIRLRNPYLLING